MMEARDGSVSVGMTVLTVLLYNQQISCGYLKILPVYRLHNVRWEEDQ
jgi:hypothetical protein